MYCLSPFGAHPQALRRDEIKVQNNAMGVMRTPSGRRGLKKSGDLLGKSKRPSAVSTAPDNGLGAANATAPAGVMGRSVSATSLAWDAPARNMPISHMPHAKGGKRSSVKSTQSAYSQRGDMFAAPAAFLVDDGDPNAAMPMRSARSSSDAATFDKPKKTKKSKDSGLNFLDEAPPPPPRAPEFVVPPGEEAYENHRLLKLQITKTTNCETHKLYIAQFRVSKWCQQI